MPPPIIRCDPPDPAFVNRVARAYGEACATLTDEMAVLVGTLVRVRAEYPRALIVTTDDARIDGQPSRTWIAFRDGWFRRCGTRRGATRTLEVARTATRRAPSERQGDWSNS
jgi:hypothetical protein